MTFKGALKQAECLMYENGKIIRINPYSLSDERINLLEKIVELVMLTDFTTEDTKQYLPKLYNTYSQVHEVAGGSQNSKTTATRKQYDIRKLKTAIADNFFNKLLDVHENLDIAYYIDKLDKLTKKYKQKGLFDNLVIKTPSPTPCTALADEELELLRYLARNYSKKAVMQTENQVTADIVGYVSYLEDNTSSLKPDDERVYLELREWLA